MGRRSRLLELGTAVYQKHFCCYPDRDFPTIRR
jgi:hypothetical protein